MECVDVNITDDTIVEGDETFFVILTTTDLQVTIDNVMTVITVMDNEGELSKVGNKATDAVFLYRCHRHISTAHAESG